MSAANALSPYRETEAVGVETGVKVVAPRNLSKPRVRCRHLTKLRVLHRLPFDFQFLRSQAHVSRHNARNQAQPALIGAQSGLSLSQPVTPLQRRDSQGGESGHRRRSGAWRARAKGRQASDSSGHLAPSLTPESFKRGAPVVVVTPSPDFVHRRLTEPFQKARRVHAD